MIKKFYYFVVNQIMTLILKSNISFLRNFYWNLSAKMIDNNWGNSKNDYAVLETVFKTVSPKKIIDIGCGSGRAFPLYKSFNVPEVYAQDVSKIAINLCKEKHPKFKCNYILSDIIKLKFDDDTFDLALSTRVLAAVLAENIDEVIKKITSISKYVYINEMSETDYLGASLYWFKHDYDTLFEKYNFKVEDTGMIVVGQGEKQQNQTWKLYKKQL